MLNLPHVRCLEDALVADLDFKREPLILLDIDVIELGGDQKWKNIIVLPPSARTEKSRPCPGDHASSLSMVPVSL